MYLPEMEVIRGARLTGYTQGAIRAVDGRGCITCSWEHVTAVVVRLAAAPTLRSTAQWSCSAHGHDTP